jgi:hypothetical protein
MSNTYNMGETYTVTAGSWLLPAIPDSSPLTPANEAGNTIDVHINGCLVDTYPKGKIQCMTTGCKVPPRYSSVYIVGVAGIPDGFYYVR